MSEKMAVEKKEELILRGWTEKHGFWSHPKRTYPHFIGGAEGPKIESHPYLFTFQQAIKAEGIQ